jgi:hypothetical protein
MTDITARLRHILGVMEDLRMDMGVLSEEIWKDIDHNDPAKLEQGFKFKQIFNDKRVVFDDAAEGLATLLRNYPNPDLDKGPAKPHEDTSSEGPPPALTKPRPQPEMEPQAEQDLNEDYKHSLPFGFTLDDKTFTGLSTWAVFYETFLQEMEKRYHDKFMKLPDKNIFGSSQDDPMFARSSEQLREPVKIVDGVYAEVRLPISAILQNLKNLVREFGLPADSLKILLKEQKRGTVMSKSIAA